MQREHVVLVDEQNNVLGTMPKSEVHHLNTPLHRAFSAFIFNSDKQLLLQQRSSQKKAWPLIWSNSCCGHPMLNETTLDAAKRRTLFELGIEITDIEEVAPYRYRFTKDGITENEICPIFFGTFDGQVNPRRDEIEAIQWVSWEEFKTKIHTKPDDYSPWCIEEADILEKTDRFKEFFVFT